MYLNWNYLSIFILMCVVSTSTEIDGNDLKVLSRRKRYVAFPEGSSFSCAVCIAIGLIGQPAPTNFPGTLTFALNWAIAWELPNNTETSLYYRYKKHGKYIAQRRSRRQLYEKLETILENMGYNGRECILKTICETTQRIVPHGRNMVEEIFRTIFTLPMSKVLPSEPSEHAIYDAAHRLGMIWDSCDKFQCPISIVDLAKGYYDAPAPDADTAKEPWKLFSSSFS